MTAVGARRPGVRLVAVAAAFTFGCVTVRAPASAIGEEIPVAGGRAEPQLELWLEGNGALPPGEVTAAAAEARAALAAALEGAADPGEDWILVARARGLARTPSRRHEQAAATVGLIAGAVVLVALIVVAVVSGKGGKGGGGSARGATPLAHGAARPPPPFLHPPPPHVRPPPPLLAPPLPHAHHGEVAWGFQANLELELWGAPDRPIPILVEEERLAWREVPALPPPAAASGGEGPGAGPAPGVVVLPPPPRLDVDGRGYFDGDTLEVELTLVDRLTGRAAWRKSAAGAIDPRDRAAVRALVGRLVVSDGWEPASSS